MHSTVIVNSFWETDLCFQCAIFLIWICESNMNESKCGWVDLLLPLLGRCSLLGRLCYCSERVIKLMSNDQCKVTEQVAFVKRNLNIQLLGFKPEIPQTRSVCLLYYCSTQTSNSLNQTQERRYENKLFKKMLAEYLVKIIWVWLCFISFLYNNKSIIISLSKS